MTFTKHAVFSADRLEQLFLITKGPSVDQFLQEGPIDARSQKSDQHEQQNDD